MDATFGSGGIVAAPADNGGAFAMVLQPDGNIVAVGNLTSTTYSDFALARYIGTLGSPALPVITVAATDSNAAEAGPDLGVFTLTRSGDTTNALTVNFTLGSATPGTDYNNVDTSVTISAGQTSATVTITPIPDTVAEGSETVTLTLASGTGYTVGSPDAATVNIANYSGGLLRGMSSVNFGNVRVGSSADKTLNITNGNTTASLVVAVNNPSPTPPFSLASGGGTVVIGPGLTQQVTLRFSPGSTVSATGTLLLNSTDPSNVTKNIALSGKGK